jgi:hypothetical protein
MATDLAAVGVEKISRKQKKKAKQLARNREIDIKLQLNEYLAKWKVFNDCKTPPLIANFLEKKGESLYFSSSLTPGNFG